MKSKLFDHEFYLHEYPDVASGLSEHNRISGAEQHYESYGFRERRNPNALFYAGWYAQKYALGPEDNPINHFVENARTNSPNPYWEQIRMKQGESPPCLAEMVSAFSPHQRPTYILGLYGTGRWYLNELVMYCSGQRGYYFLDDLRHRKGGPPIIWSGHTTVIHDQVAGHEPAALGRSVLKLAEEGAADIIFIHRHPLDSLLTNWTWWREFLAKKKMISGIVGKYSTQEEFFKDVANNFDELALFADGSKDFMRLYSEEHTHFFSLRQFVVETAAFVNHESVHSFRFEDFISEPNEQFSRIMRIIDPLAISGKIDVPKPRAEKNRYIEVCKHVPAFKNLVESLPRDVKLQINELGYQM
ncbi:MAG: hypothetical protein KIT82_00385 [Bradyrhizobium sp.]|nr:hypothetical protein [Bradyrhizobium sp.]